MKNKTFKSLKDMGNYLEENKSLLKENIDANEKNAEHPQKRKKDKFLSFDKYLTFTKEQKRSFLTSRGISFSYQGVEYLPEIKKAIIPGQNPFTKGQLVVDVIFDKNMSTIKIKKSGSAKIKGHIAINSDATEACDILVFKEGKALPGESISKKQKKRINQIIERGVVRPIENQPAGISDICFGDFVTLEHTNSCISKNHAIEDITGIISIITKSGAIQKKLLAAGYCTTCKKYFIEAWQYEKILEIGVPVCQIIKEPSYNTSSNGQGFYSKLSAESELHRAGYTVNSTDDLSVAQRRMILVCLMESGVSKTKITSHLNWLIRQRQGMKNMEKAVKKWESDRQYVASYKLGSQRKVAINLIRTRDSKKL